MKYKDFPEWYKKEVPEFKIPNFSQITLFKLIDKIRHAAIEQDRKGREETPCVCQEEPAMYGGICVANMVEEAGDLVRRSDTLSAKLVKLAELSGISKEEQEWVWFKGDLLLWDAHYSGNPVDPISAVDVALEETTDSP